MKFFTWPRVGFWDKMHVLPTAPSASVEWRISNLGVGSILEGGAGATNLQYQSL